MKRFLILMLSLLLLCGCAAKGSGQKVDAKPELVTKEDSGTQGDCRYENPYLTLSGVSASTAKLFDTYYAGIHDEYARRLRADAKAGATSFTVEYAQRALTSRVLSVLRTCRVENPETVTVTPAGETFDPQTGLQLSAVSLFACPKEVADVRVLDLVRARLEAGECFGFAGEEAELAADWSDKLERAYDREQFVLTESGYLVYFLPGKLAEDAIGVYLPYRELQDILVLPS